jgi:transcriptional repressor NrdR
MPKKSAKTGKSTRKRTTTTARKAKGGKATKAKKRSKPRKLVVRRTSGRKEKFDKDRMAQTVSRSGTPFLMARDVAKTVSSRISRNKGALGTGGDKSEVEIDGSVIREMVADEIKSRNRPDIAASLSGESPENTRQGRHEMANDNEPVLDKTAANRTKLLYDNSSRSVRSTKAPAS